MADTLDLTAQFAEQTQREGDMRLMTETGLEMAGVLYTFRSASKPLFGLPSDDPVRGCQIG